MNVVTRPMMDLEADLCDAVNMAHIASSLLENAVGDSKLHLDLTGRPNLYHINPDTLDAMVFAVCEVERRVACLRDDYLKAMSCA